MKQYLKIIITIMLTATCIDTHCMNHTNSIKTYTSLKGSDKEFEDQLNNFKKQCSYKECTYSTPEIEKALMQSLLRKNNIKNKLQKTSQQTITTNNSRHNKNVSQQQQKTAIQRKHEFNMYLFEKHRYNVQNIKQLKKKFDDICYENDLDILILQRNNMCYKYYFNTKELIFFSDYEESSSSNENSTEEYTAREYV